MSQLKKLISEIHHRSLWQVLLVYVGAAWACFELIDTVTERLGLPVWLPGFAIVLFLLGLPFVVATALVREEAAPLRAEETPTAETTPVQAQREAAARRRRFLTRRNAVASFVVALAVWGVVATGWILLGRAGKAADREKTIAVLPFENLSDEENQAFTDGLHDAVLTHLYKIADLSPRSRTTVMEYRERRGDVKQIAEELGVATIMEGTVARVGERLRVNVQLIDAEADEHIWAELYDRDFTLENVFAVQSDIALQIATALQAELTQEEQGRIAVGLTDNLEAYTFFQLGNEYYYRLNYRLAIEMYERAVELDPGFALAHARLSIANSEGWFQARQGSRERAGVSAEQALALAPDLAEGHSALGNYHYFRWEVDQAIEEYSIALELSPNDYAVYFRIGRLQERLGEYALAVESYERALRLGPLNRDALFEAGRLHLTLRNYELAGEFYGRAIQLAPDDWWPYFWRAFVYLLSAADTANAYATLQQMAAKAGEDIDRIMRFEPHPWGRATARALSHYYLEDVLSSDDDSYQLKALYNAMAGDIEESRVWYDSSRAVNQARIDRDQRPGLRFFFGLLGIAYAGLGHREQAIEAGLRAVEIIPVSEDTRYGAAMIQYLAEIYVMVGDYEAAINQLELLLSIPAHISVGLLRIDPLYDPLRDHPRFQALLEKYDQPER